MYKSNIQKKSNHKKIDKRLAYLSSSQKNAIEIQFDS